MTMANHVHEQSKDAMCAFARQVIRGLILMLREVGCSYEFIEKQLKLHPRNGMTVWEYVEKKKK
jgi:hypothetical protein